MVLLRDGTAEHRLRAAGIAVHRLGTLPWPSCHAVAAQVIQASRQPAYCHLLSAPDLAQLWRLGCRTVPVVHNAVAGWAADPAVFNVPEVPFVAASATPSPASWRPAACASRSGCCATWLPLRSP